MNLRFEPSLAKSRPNLIVKKCRNCHTEFACYKSCDKNMCYCKKSCFQTFIKNRQTVAKVLDKDGFFLKHLCEYQDKIISAPYSPSGKAYIGIAKEPLMQNESGFGFMGVVLQDESRQLIQCSGCGEWKRKITNHHLNLCCGLTIQQYKEKFGLNAATGLVSDETSLKLTKCALKNKVAIRAFKKNTGKGMKGRHGRDKKHSIEFYNKFGTCPLQLQTRLIEFIKCNRELPAQGNRGRAIYKALVRRYGSWGHALQSHGLPFFKRVGTNMLYVFSDGTKYKYNINQMNDREELYSIIREKCPALQ